MTTGPVLGSCDGASQPVTMTRVVVFSGLMCATSIVLMRYLAVMVPVAGVLAVRLSFGEIPIMLSGLMFGPVAGALVGACADVIGCIIAPVGPYFPGITLSYALDGALPPILAALALRLLSARPALAEQKRAFIALASAILVTDVIVALGLTTTWLHILYGKPILALLPARLLGRAILVPCYIAVIHVLMGAYARAFGVAGTWRQKQDTV